MNRKKKKKFKSKPNAVAKALRDPGGQYRKRVEKQKKGTGSYDRKDKETFEE